MGRFKDLEVEILDLYESGTPTNIIADCLHLPLDYVEEVAYGTDGSLDTGFIEPLDDDFLEEDDQYDI